MVAPNIESSKKKAYIIEQHVCYRRLLDASKLANYFRANDCAVTDRPEEADYKVLFTCAVTSKIEDEGFQAMDKLSTYPGELIVMGCLPDIAPAKFNDVFKGRSLVTRDMDNVDELFPDYKVPYANIPEPYDKLENFPPPCVPSKAEVTFGGRHNWLTRLKRLSVSKIGLTRVMRYFHDRIAAARRRARHENPNTYHFRISRGCKGHCTYCGIKHAIGPLKSRPLQECLDDYAALVKKGYKHFHILAEDVGAYGLDIDSSFAELLEKMSEIDQGHNVTWSITEVNIVWAVKYRTTLTRMMRNRKLNILQIAQESGSERILKRIKKYSLTHNLDAAVAEFRKANPYSRISGLFIVGFPGETEEDFQQTLASIKRNYHDGVNLAPYSDREGTVASLFTDKIDGKVIRDRLERAMAFLDREKITWTVSS